MSDDVAARDEWTRLLTQVLSAVATLAAERLGMALEAGAASEGMPPDDGRFYRVEIGLPESRVSFYVGFPAMLLEELENAEQIPSEAQDLSEPVISAAAVDLLLDVELPLSVSFGRTYMPVRDILRFTTGSVVELNRHVSDYVDVIVNNCVIARGEVVVIEGNYGIRVHEIVSRQQRAMLQHLLRSAPVQTTMKASA